MSLKQGDIFWCENCSCELTLSRIPTRIQLESSPTCCCCGRAMKKR